jgi:hypothetical protein
MASQVFENLSSLEFELRKLNYMGITNVSQKTLAVKKEYESALSKVMQIAREYEPYIAERFSDILMRVFSNYSLNKLNECIEAYKRGEFNKNNRGNDIGCQVKRFIDEYKFVHNRKSVEGKLAQQIEEFARSRGAYFEYGNNLSWIDSNSYKTQDNIIQRLRSGDIKELLAYLSSEEKEMLMNKESTDEVKSLIQRIQVYQKENAKHQSQVLRRDERNIDIELI